MEKGRKMRNRQGQISGKIKVLLSVMSLDEKIGHLFLVGFSGGEIDADVMRKIKKIKPAGFFLSPNWQLSDAKEGEPEPSPWKSIAEYTSVVAKVQELVMENNHNIPAFFICDQEGGAIWSTITRGGINLLPMLAGLGEADNIKITRQWAKINAGQMKALGIKWLLNPVLDVNLNKDNPEINIRSFGDKPSLVAKHAVQMIKTYQAEGIIATAKHFPGRGNSAVNSHFELPVNNSSYQELLKSELMPYLEVINKAGVEAIMLGHTNCPALDSEGIPATFSKNVINLLRGELGFKGLIITDSMTMKGITARYAPSEAVARAVESGVDAILLYEGPLVNKAVKRIKDYIKEGKISVAQIERSVAKMLKLKYKYGLFSTPKPDPQSAEKIIKDEKIRTASQKIADNVIVVQRNNDLPLKNIHNDKFLVVEPKIKWIADMNDDFQTTHMLYDAVKKRHARTSFFQMDEMPAQNRITQLMEMIKSYDIIITAQYDLTGTNNSVEKQYPFLKKLYESHNKVIVIINNPYILPKISFAGNVVVSYGMITTCIEAAVKAIFGDPCHTLRKKKKSQLLLKTRKRLRQ